MGIESIMHSVLRNREKMLAERTTQLRCGPQQIFHSLLYLSFLLAVLMHVLVLSFFLNVYTINIRVHCGLSAVAKFVLTNKLKKEAPERL